ncbi:LOW QUALITY PROTEIN: hypothetical protein CRUP_013081 [Coryphaenoides rupestris]|nr:LOW QUALITY PROTEIN: hypothetical protein CRUP_013081 [Coryphaenoides rupestris]
MSKKCIMSSQAEAAELSPSQVYLQKLHTSSTWSSGVFQELLTTGSSSYNVLLQVEDEEQRGAEEWHGGRGGGGGGGGNPKRSPSRRQRQRTSVKSASAAPHRKKPLAGAPVPLSARRPDSGGGDCGRAGRTSTAKPARTIGVLGNAMGLSQRPVARGRDNTHKHSKLPSLPRSSTTHRVDNGRKLCILAAIKPSNVEKEKAKFFKSDFNYNPQFEYSNPVSPLYYSCAELSEVLRWPDTEMSKKCIMSSQAEAAELSPSQVYLQKLHTSSTWSSGVFQELLTTGSSSYNVLLQVEDEEQRGAEEWHGEAVAVEAVAEEASASAAPHRKKPLAGAPVPLSARRPDSGGGDCGRAGRTSTAKPARTIGVLGNAMGLSQRPVARGRDNTHKHSKLPSLPRSSTTHRVDNGRKLCILAAIKPSNVEKEKAKFFKSDFNYNPQFEYSNPVSPLLALNKYGSYENFEQATGGSLLSRSRISANSLHDGGTHYFRSINNSRQPWCGSAGRRRHGLRPLNPTEEGLASLHSVLYRRDPTLWRAALLYYTVHLAARASFSQLFLGLGRFVQDPHTRWDYCVRAKRGQVDTAQPGCFSKDQVYLEGILNILRYREQIDFTMLMALGKDRAAYARQLDKIMEANELTDHNLRLLIV